MDIQTHTLGVVSVMSVCPEEVGHNIASMWLGNRLLIVHSCSQDQPHPKIAFHKSIELGLEEHFLEVLSFLVFGQSLFSWPLVFWLRLSWFTCTDIPAHNSSVTCWMDGGGVIFGISSTRSINWNYNTHCYCLRQTDRTTHAGGWTHIIWFRPYSSMNPL